MFRTICLFTICLTILTHASPTLEIISPKNNERSIKPLILFKGQTSGTKLTINDAPIPIDSKQRFYIKAHLFEDQPNAMFKLTASNYKNKKTTITRHVNYYKQRQTLPSDLYLDISPTDKTIVTHKHVPISVKSDTILTLYLNGKKINQGKPGSYTGMVTLEKENAYNTIYISGFCTNGHLFAKTLTLFLQKKIKNAEEQQSLIIKKHMITLSQSYASFGWTPIPEKTTLQMITKAFPHHSQTPALKHCFMMSHPDSFLIALPYFGKDLQTTTDTLLSALSTFLPKNKAITFLWVNKTHQQLEIHYKNKYSQPTLWLLNDTEIKFNKPTYKQKKALDRFRKEGFEG